MHFDNSNYVLLSRQVGVLRESMVLSNNIANSETPGFKNATVVFKQFVHHASNKDRISFNFDVLSIKDFSSGKLVQTGNNLDLALVGNGFFRIAGPGGEMYTRAGNFQINGLGQIVTAQGYPVLNEGGEPINVAGNVDELEIRDNGAITVNNEVVGQLGMAFFDDEQFLEPVGNYLYKAITPPTYTGQYVLYQGMLELSNVNNIAEMTRMREMQENMSTVSNIVTMIDQLERDSFKVFTDGA